MATYNTLQDFYNQVGTAGSVRTIGELFNNPDNSSRYFTNILNPGATTASLDLYRYTPGTQTGELVGQKLGLNDVNSLKQRIATGYSPTALNVQGSTPTPDSIYAQQLNNPSGAGYQVPTPTVSSAPQSPQVAAPAPSAGILPQSQPLAVGGVNPSLAGQVQALQNIQQPQRSAYSGAAGYTGPSIVDFLKQAGQPNDFASRTKLAGQYGIINYTGTAAQNTKLLGILKGLAQSSTSIQQSASSIAPIPPATNAVNQANGISVQGNTASGYVTGPGGRLYLPNENIPSADQSSTPSTPNQPPTSAGGIPSGLTTTTSSSESNGRLMALEKQLEALQGQLTDSLKPSDQELGLQQQLSNLNTSKELGVADIANQPIALPFVTGQQAAVERSASLKALPLQTQLANIQARRQAAIDVGKTNAGFAENALARENTYQQQNITNALNQQKSNTEQIGNALYQRQPDGSYKLAAGSNVEKPQILGSADSGYYTFDANTGQLKPLLAGGGGSTAKPALNVQLQTSIDSALKQNNAFGADKKVSWETYQWMKQNWVANNGSPADFEVIYPITRYLDANNQAEFYKNS